jgi:chemotaxis family two-component system sensor kinase Cph1
MQADPSFAQIFEESDDPAFVIDPFGDKIVAANPAGCAMLGYTREELLATPVSSIHPAELPQLQELLERVLKDGQGSTIALTCRTKSGCYLPTEMALSALESSGTIYILGLVHDRSDHRQPDPC